MASKFITILLGGIVTVAATAGTPNAGEQFRISDMGIALDPAYSAYSPAIAYNSSQRSFLVAWSATDSAGSLDPAEFEIYAQHVDAATGLALNEERIRVSFMANDGDSRFVAKEPRVAYNTQNDEYLVVWWSENRGGLLDPDKNEIYAQRISAGDLSLLGNRIRVSFTGSEDDSSSQARQPDVAYANATNEFFVVWEADDSALGLADQEYEILGQRLDGSTGDLIGPPKQLSDMGVNGNVSYNAFDARVIYNAAQQEYLVGWEGQDNVNGLVDGKDVVFVQRIDALTGQEIGTNDMQVSFNGSNDNSDVDASNIEFAWDSRNNEYLIVWNADGATDNDFEIYGRRMDALSGTLIHSQFRISSMSGSAFWGLNPDITYNSEEGLMQVIWRGEATSNNEWEIFGAQFDRNNYRVQTGQISSMGPAGSSSFDAGLGAVAYAPEQNRSLVVWDGNHEDLTVSPDEYEVYGRFVPGDFVFGSSFDE